tara:strand:+ start:372 stop:587 length:216 start_codon:yes stop_codon:yes gene_type:complete
MQNLEIDFSRVKTVIETVVTEQRNKNNHKTASLIELAPEMLDLIKFIYKMEKKENRYGSVRRLCESLLSRI